MTLLAHQIATRAIGGTVSVTIIRDPADGTPRYAVSYESRSEHWLSRHRFQDVSQADAGAVDSRRFPGRSGALMAKSAHYQILWAIMADERLSAAAKCVATALLLKYRNNETGQCNPSYGKLAKAVGRTRRPVIAAFGELRELGWIDWTGTKGGTPSNTNSFQFFLTPKPVLHTAPVSSTTPVLDTTPTGAADSTQPVLRTAHELSINHLRTIKACRVAKTTPTKTEYSEDFETKFWVPYPRSPTMSKKEAWREWMKLTPEQRTAARQAIEPFKKYLRSKPNLETVHACRFLSQQRFDGFINSPASPQPALDIRSSII